MTSLGSMESWSACIRTNSFTCKANRDPIYKKSILVEITFDNTISLTIVFNYLEIIAS